MIASRIADELETGDRTSTYVQAKSIYAIALITLLPNVYLYY